MGAENVGMTLMVVVWCMIMRGCICTGICIVHKGDLARCSSRAAVRVSLLRLMIG